MTPLARRKTGRQPNRPYTDDDVTAIQDLADAGYSQRAIARKLHRHPGSIAGKCASLGIRLLGTAGRRSEP